MFSLEAPGQDLFPGLSQLLGPPVLLAEATASIFTANHSTLCSVITSPLALLGILVITPDPLDNTRESPHLKILNFLLFAKSLLPYKVMYSRVQGLGHLWRAIILSITAPRVKVARKH